MWLSLLVDVDGYIAEKRAMAAGRLLRQAAREIERRGPRIARRFAAPLVNAAGDRVGSVAAVSGKSDRRPSVSVSHLLYELRNTESFEFPQRLTVRRADGRSGISWDELQAVKNEALGSDAVCIEVYPPQKDVVDETNSRHLWCTRIDVPCLAWQQP